MKIQADIIVNGIVSGKPQLPPNEVLEKIRFQWNDEELDTWDGGFDLNEETRKSVVQGLEKRKLLTDPELIDILRFLLKQEIENCIESECLTDVLTTCYDSLANFRHLEDVPLLLEANHSSFDAHCGLFKDRLFYNGYASVMQYLKTTQTVDKEIVDGVSFYAEYFGYDKGEKI